MSKTEVSGKQLKDGSVELVDLSPELAGDLSQLKTDVATLQSDVASKPDTSSLATVATSGSYNDLSDKPSIPSVVGLASETYVDTAVAGKADSASLASVATSGSYTDLTNKPSLFSGDYGDLANKPSIPSVVGLASETYVDTAVAAVVNSAPAVLDTLKELSDALAGDANFATTVAGQIGDVASDVSVLDGRVTSVEADVAALQGASAPNLSDLGEVSITSPSSGQVLKYDGLGWVNVADSTFSGVYADLTGKPTLFDGAYASLTGAPSLASVATSGSYADLSNKPTLASFATLTSPASGQYLRYNGTAWVNAAIVAADLPVAQQSSGIIDTGFQIFSGDKRFNGIIQAYGGVAAKAPAINQPALRVSPFSVSQSTSLIYLENPAGGAAYTVDTTGASAITLSSASAKGLVVKGAASQTASLFEVQNSSSQILNKIGSDGSVSMYDSAGANGFTLANNSGEAKLSVAAGKTFSVASTGAYNYVSSFSVADEGGTNAFSKGKWTIRTTQTAALNIVPSYGDGNFFGGVGILVPNNRYIGARFHIFNITDAANRGDTDPMDNYSGQSKTSLLIHGYSNHTANHIEIQDQNNNIMFAIGGQGQIKAPTAASKALVVQGAASQSANLFEAQNSAGTALASISAVGQISGLGLSILHTFGSPTTTGVNLSGVTSNNYIVGAGNARTLMVKTSGVFAALETTDGTNSLFASSVYGISAQNVSGQSWAVGLTVNNSSAASTTIMALQSVGVNKFVVDKTGAITTAGAATFSDTVHAKRYTETVANAFNTSLAPSTGTLTVDTSTGNAVLGALSASVTTWAFTNVPTENSKVTTVSAVIAGNTSYTYGSSCSVNGSAVATGVQWFGGTAPASSSSTDVLTFVIVKDSAGTIKVLGSAQTVDSVVGSASAGIDGAGSANYLSKWTDANTIANSVIYETGGKIGIGTTSPGNPLHVVAASQDAALGIIRAENTYTPGTNVGTNCSITTKNYYGTSQFMQWENFGVRIGSRLVTNSGSGSVMFTSGADVERMRMDPSGNILFGKTAANQTSAGAHFATENVAIDGSPTYLYLTKTFNGLRNAILFHHNGTYCGGLNFDNTSTALATSSDYRLKENVTPIGNALEKIEALKPCKFNFISDPSVEVEGFIAHELQEVLPRAVFGEKDATEIVDGEEKIKPQSVDATRIIPLLAAALKQLNAKVDALQAEKDALEARLAALENN